MKYCSDEARAQYRFMVMMRESYWMEHFNSLAPLLAEDCMLESQWLSVYENGKAAVKAFLDKSLEERWNKNIVWHYGVAEILKAPDASDRAGLFGLHIKRETDEAYNSILVTAEMDEQGHAKRLWIENAALYMFQVFLRCVSIELSSETGMDPPGAFLLPDTYLDYLGLGMAYAGRQLRLPRSHLWQEELLKAIDTWRSFCFSDRFDEAFETMAGVNYAAGTVERPQVAGLLGLRGKGMWENRHRSFSMIDLLAEWAENFGDGNVLLRLRERRVSDELRRERRLS